MYVCDNQCQLRTVMFHRSWPNSRTPKASGNRKIRTDEPERAQLAAEFCRYNNRPLDVPLPAQRNSSRCLFVSDSSARWSRKRYDFEALELYFAAQFLETSDRIRSRDPRC